MSPAQFFADIVESGTVLGADVTWSPERVAGLFGDDYGDNPSKHSLGRDHGLVEFFWQRATPRDPWEGTHFSVQAHRLQARDGALINPLILERYGPFDGPVAFDDVSTLLTARGVELTEVPYRPSPEDIRTCWQPGSRTMVYVTGESGYYGRTGDIYRVSSPSTGRP